MNEKSLHAQREFFANAPKGFTLIEVLVVIGIIAVLATMVLVAINPARQFAQAHNSQRTSNVHAILNGIGQNIADNKGMFSGCQAAAAGVPATSTIMSSGEYDILPCLVPTYLPDLPLDPTGPPGGPAGFFTGTSSYNTHYSIQYSTSTGRITISAPYAELGQTISITR